MIRPYHLPQAFEHPSMGFHGHSVGSGLLQGCGQQPGAIIQDRARDRLGSGPDMSSKSIKAKPIWAELVALIRPVPKRLVSVRDWRICSLLQLVFGFDQLRIFPVRLGPDN
jgi:hypothetical protein